MDKGIIVLMAFAMLLIATIVGNTLGILSTQLVNSVIALSLFYHTGYALFAMIEWSSRTRIRNKNRGNMRPPRSDKRNPWN